MTVAHSGRWAGGVWKLAPCLVAMEAQADALAPKRRRSSDGSIGDHAHAVRRSDHNPDEEGVTDWVDALDITHDPAGGMDIHARLRDIARRVQRGEEKRVSYLISNWEIFSERDGVWAWRRYTGPNGHTQHGHISVNDQNRHDTSPWFTTTAPTPAPPRPSATPAPAQENDDMGMWFRITNDGGEHSGKVFHVYGREFFHITDPAQWEADQQFHGAVAKEVTASEFLSYVARRGLTDGRKR